jgi:hypothetical protein
MQAKTLMMALLAIPALSLAATPVAADCDNYGNQVNVGSNYDCAHNEQYCDQGTGAGAGAGAGGNGKNSAGADAGATTTCSSGGGYGSGGCVDATRMVALSDSVRAQATSDPSTALATDTSAVVATVVC